MSPVTRSHDLLAHLPYLLRSRTVSMSTVAMLVVPAISCLPSAAEAQQEVRAVLTDVPRDARLEITAPGLWLSDVTLRDVGPDSVQVVNHGAIVPVAFAEIETLAVREGHGVLGAAVGGGSGLLAGGVFGLMVGSFGCRDPVACEADDRRGAVVGGLIGVGVGAVLGYWIGSGSVRWKPVFPEP